MIYWEDYLIEEFGFNEENSRLIRLGDKIRSSNIYDKIQRLKLRFSHWCFGIVNYSSRTAMEIRK